MPTPSLHDPLDLDHGPAWTNRFTLAPLTNKQSNADGTISEDEYRWLTARARGGFAMTLTCATYVDPLGQAWQGQLGISDDRHLPGLARLAEGIREAGSVSAVQLHHGGRRSDPGLHGESNVAPWDEPEKNTRALTTDGVKASIDAFVAAAVRAERAGFDGVQLHGAHGYLLGQFLDARHNHREDGYGGSMEDRSRIIFDIIDGIRATTGPEFQLGIRLTPEGSGITIAEARELVTGLIASGKIDHIDMSLWDAFKAPSSTGTRPSLIEEFTSLLRGTTRLGVAGKVLSGADAQWCLDQGADFIAVGTAAIIHHDFPRSVFSDPAFVSTPQPVSRKHLQDEEVGEPFIDYLATNWNDFVS